MTSKTSNLFKRGKNYSVRYCVPKELWSTVGKREIIRGLSTPSLSEAERRRPRAIFEIEQSVYEKQRVPVHKPHIRTLPVQEEATESGVPVSQAAFEWLRMCDGIAASTKIGYGRVLRAFEKFTMDMDVRLVNRQVALGFLEHLKTTGSMRTGKLRSPKTIKTNMITLSSFWKVCRYLGYVDQDMANPFNGVTSQMPGTKRVKQTTKELRPVTRQEAERLLTIVENGDRYKYGYEITCILKLLWVTGCRLNEICSLERSQIEEHGDCISFRLTDTKTEAGNRLIYLVGENECQLVREALRDALRVKPDSPDNEPLLFPRLRRGGYDRKPSWFVGKSIEVIRREEFGSDTKWDMHSFRRNAVSALVNAGVPVAERNLVVGHSNKADIGVSIYAKEGDLRKIVRGTFEVLYGELGGALD